MSTATPQPRDLELLRAMPLADTAVDPGARDDARTRLLDAIAIEAPQHAPLIRRTPKPARATVVRRRLLAGTTALVLATVAIAAGLGGGNDTPIPGVTQGGGLVSRVVGVPSASAADALRAAAAAAVGQPTVPFTADTQWVVRSEQAEMILNHGQTAIGPDGRPVAPLPAAYYAALRITRGSETTSYDGDVMVSKEPSGQPQFTTKASRDAYAKVGADLSSKGGSYPLVYAGHGTKRPFIAGSKSLSYDDLEALPTDTPTLAKWVFDAATITDNVGKKFDRDDWSQVQVITDLMTRAPLSPALRAGLWRVAAGLPSLKLLGPTRDPAGRTGTGLSIETGDEREQIVFSPQTGMLLSAWIYKTSAITTCDDDLRYCSPAEQRAGDHGKPWTPLTLPGTVERGTTVLSAAVEPK